MFNIIRSAAFLIVLLLSVSSVAISQNKSVANNTTATGTEKKQKDGKQGNRDGKDKKDKKGGGNLDNHCIEVDALNCCDGHNAVPKCIKENSVLALKVYNVNPFKNSVSASGKTTMIDFGNDSLFTFNFSPEPEKPADPKAEKEEKDNERTIAPGSKDCCKDLDSIKKAKERIVKIQQCTKQFSDALYQLNLLHRTENELQKLFDTVFITKTAFTKRMWGILECLGLSKTCECETKTDSCCNCQAHKKYKDLYGSLLSAYDCLKDEYNNLMSDKKKPVNFKLSGKLADKDKGISLEIKDAKGSFEAEEDDGSKAFFYNLTMIYKKATSDSIKEVLLSSAEYIDECISNLCSYTAEEFYQQNYVKTQVTGDYIFVTPFVKKQNGDTIQLRDFPEYKIRIRGGHRANVSTGISFSFFGMNDDDYSITRTNTDSEFVIKKTVKGANLYIPSLTSFLHFYNRNCGYLQGAATIGLSVNPTNLQSLKVMAGYSLIFGEERRGIFSFGIIGGAVDRLKTKYERDKTLLYKDYPGLQETDLIAKRFRIGGFIGLSYNLSKQR
jgi:hypothetical protein